MATAVGTAPTSPPERHRRTRTSTRVQARSGQGLHAMSAVGQTRSWNGSNGGPSRAFEYREGDHIFVVEWDPRETGTVIAEYFERWTEPSSEPIDPAARERIFDGLWAVGQTAGLRRSSTNRARYVAPSPRDGIGATTAFSSTSTTVASSTTWSVVARCAQLPRRGRQALRGVREVA